MKINYDIVRHLDVKWKNTTKMLLSFMSNLQTYYHFKPDFQKVDQHTKSKWLTDSTKHRKDNQLQSVELPCRIL